MSTVRNDHLHISEPVLSALFGSSPFPVLVVGSDRVYFANSRAARLLVAGHQEDLTKHRSKDVLPDIDSVLQSSRSTTSDQPIALQLTALDGQKLIVEAATWSIEHDRLVVNILNHERAQKIQGLADSELRLRSRVLESMAEGVSVTTEDGIIVYTNPAEDRMFGYERGELLGKHVTVQNAYPPEENARLVESVIETLKQHGRWSGEWRNRRKDGTPFTTQAYITALELEGRNHWICVQEDISARKEAEAALRDSEATLQLAHAVSGLGTWTWIPDTNQIALSDPLRLVLGVPRDAVSTFERWMELVHSDDRARVINDATEAAKSGKPLDHAYRIVRPDGEVRWVLGRGQAVDGRVIGVNIDITERRNTETALRETQNKLSLIAEAARTLLAAPDSSEVLPNLIQLAQRFMPADAYALWRRVHEEGRWELVSSEGLSAGFSRSENESHINGSPPPLQMAAYEDVFQHDSLSRRWNQYQMEGIRSLLVVPLRVHGQAAGTLVFYYRSVHQFTEAEQTVASALGNLASAALTTAELYGRESALREQAQAAEARSRFLAQAGALLGASLDYEETLRHVARLAVPVFSDWSAVDLLDEGEILHRVAVEHRDLSRITLAVELERRYPPRETDATREVVRTRQSFFMEDIPDGLIESRAQDPEHATLIRQLGLRSIIVTPMISQGKALGVLTFATAESGRRYDSSDLVLAEELARRAATAIENARLHEGIRESEARYRRIFQTAGVSLWEEDFSQVKDQLEQLRGSGVVDLGAYLDHNPDETARLLRQVRLKDANDASLRLFGAITKEELLTSLSRIFLPETLPLFREELLAIWEGRQRLETETELQALSGKRLNVLFGMELSPDDPSLQSVLVSIMDISDRKRAEETLKRSETYWRDLADRAPAMLWITSPDARCTYLSRRWLEFTGLPLEQGLGFGWLRAVHPEDRGYARRTFSEHNEQRTPFAFDCRVRRHDGEWRWVIDTGEPRFTPSGEFLGYIGKIIDITERKNAEDELRRSNDELREANAELEEFAYVASHDLQEPLRAVNIYTQMLLRKHVPQTEQAQVYASFVSQGVRRMEELLRDLLSYSRTIHSDRQTTGVADLNQALSSAVSVLKTRIDETGTTIEHDELPKVSGEESQLTQVFQNLISNAIKYAKPGERPTVWIRDESRGGETIVSLRDNGIGFEPEYAERIFGLFKRLHKDQYPGTGLGLAICKRIVERYGGRIWAESQPGAGSTFYLALPELKQARDASAQG